MVQSDKTKQTANGYPECGDIPDCRNAWLKMQEEYAQLRHSFEMLPEWRPDAQTDALAFSVDMNNGFVREGALASPRVAEIVPLTLKFLKECQTAGLPIIGVTDCHEPDAVELTAYPAHCLKDTAESEPIAEIRPFLSKILPKNSTNAFFAPDFQELVKDVQTVVLTGCCTDICIYQLALALKAWANQENRLLRVIVPRQLTATYDGPGHPGDFMEAAALASMLGNGIQVVNYR